MLLKHSALYVLGRAGPAVLNFAGILIYTRLLSPTEYGRYSLVISSVGLANMVLFQWLRISLVRFYPAYMDQPNVLMGSVIVGFVTVSSFSSAVGLVLGLVWPDRDWKGILLVGTVLVLARAWFELTTELARARLEPVRYGMINGIKAAAALAIGATLTVLGLGAFGPLLGLILGMTLAAAFGGRAIWPKTGFQWSLSLLKEMIVYGFPLSITAALAFFIHSSDRFFIQAFLDEYAVGTYAVGYDLAQQTLTVVFMCINLAATPLAITALERGGLKAAEKQLRQNGNTFVLVTVPMAILLVLFDKELFNLLVPIQYLHGALEVFPWIVLCAWLQGIKSYFIDSVFYLAKKTSLQVWTVIPSAVVNALCNYVLIPVHGVLGAAYSTLIAYAVALVLSLALTRRIWRSLSVGHTLAEYNSGCLGGVYVESDNSERLARRQQG